MTLQNLTRRKSRTILTVLGVVVGCCAIVTMMSIGFGVQNSQQIMLEGMGDLTLIQVYSGGRKDTKLDDDAIRKFQNIANVDVAVGKTQLNNVNMTVYAGDNDRYQMQWVNVVGINKDAMEKFGFQLLEAPTPSSRSRCLPDSTRHTILWIPSDRRGAIPSAGGIICIPTIPTPAK